jgi:hypothetical protein
MVIIIIMLLEVVIVLQSQDDHRDARGRNPEERCMSE